MITRFVIDTIGATAPEFVSAGLALHPHVSVLPGLAFVRDDLRLYRPHKLEGLDAATLFDRLWAPSFEPSGRMWAGIARHMPLPDYLALDVPSARFAFAREWSPASSYIETLFQFALAVSPLFDAWKPGFTHIGFCGAPFLRTLDWDELVHKHIRVISAETTLPVWLALISFRSIVNCVDAIKTWILHALLLAAAQRRGVQICSVDAIAAGEHRAIRPALQTLGVDDSLPLRAHPGIGHVTFDAKLFGRVRALAADLEAIFKGDSLYEAALHVKDWAPEAVASPQVCRLLDRYIQYWRSTAHIHFDSVGPLEDGIVDAALNQAAQPALTDTRSFEQRFSQRFFFELVRFRSYTFQTPVIEQDFYLGELEKLVKIPCAPYFAHAALCYLERGLDTQRKWFDSCMPVSESVIYRTLGTESFSKLMGSHDFGLRLEALAKSDRELVERAVERANGPHHQRNGKTSL